MSYRFVIFMSTQLKVLKYDFNNQELGHFLEHIHKNVYFSV